MVVETGLLTQRLCVSGMHRGFHALASVPNYCGRSLFFFVLSGFYQLLVLGRVSPPQRSMPVLVDGVSVVTPGDRQEVGKAEQGAVERVEGDSVAHAGFGRQDVIELDPFINEPVSGSHCVHVSITILNTPSRAARQDKRAPG